METLTKEKINTNKLTEKIELTKKLGMNECTKVLCGIKELVDMKFPYTTWKEVQFKVWKQGLKAAYKTIALRSLFFPGLISTVFFVAALLSECPRLLALQFAVGVFLFSYPLSFLRWICDDLKVRWSWLADWKHNIPYGALLAVEEAIGRGIKEFKIFYPAMEEKLADPILIGHTESGNIVELFNWDDGVLYE